MNRGLKTASRLYTRTSAGSPAWTLAQTDTYSYDANLDYLTGAIYGDGQANATPTWSYDAAGNRNDAVTDNLNRATSIGGVSCTNDILGNRLTKGSNTMTWDSLNRMLTYNSTSYVYRADGMRVKKSSATGSTAYRYDGQMGMEDVEVAGANTTVTDYAIGARGVDGISSAVNGGGSSLSYPIYDAHGNMISTLARNGTGYTYSATRGFDAWGVIRVGGQTGDPKGRYCANLGHKQDDESGLVYMRARYYEAGSGRFVSEDRSREGLNLYIYCGNIPNTRSDVSGHSWFDCQAAIFASFVKAMSSGLPVAEALAMFIADALKDVNHYYFVEIGLALQLEAIIAADLAYANAFCSGIPGLSEETIDALQSKASQHRMEGAIIKAFGSYEIVMYCLIMELTDPLLGMG